MIDFRAFLDQNEIQETTRHEIYKNDWFIGSALVGQDFESFNNGKYFYEQDTIWTRIIDLEEVNPYWEIHNKTQNFLFVNLKINESLKNLFDILNIVKFDLNMQKSRFTYITNDKEIQKNLRCNGQIYVEKKLPFFIENIKVGNYFKVFIYDEMKQKFYPIVDCTRFFFNDKEFFDININNFYVEMAKCLFSEMYTPLKYETYFKIFDKEWGIKQILGSQEKVKLISLVDCLTYLSKNECKISSAHSGHIVKKILKKYVLYSLINDKEPSQIFSVLNQEYINYIQKELNNYQKVFPKLICKYNSHILEDRYGISQEIYQYLTKEYKFKKYGDLDLIRYFTDVPFIRQRVDYSEFKELVDKIEKVSK